MDYQQRLVDRIFKASDDFQKNIDQSVENSKYSSLRLGYSLIGFLVIVTIVGDTIFAIFSDATGHGVLSNEKFLGLLVVAIVMIGLGHWVAIDERRMVERRDQQLLEMRKTDIEYLTHIENTSIERMKNITPAKTQNTAQSDTIEGI